MSIENAASEVADGIIKSITQNYMLVEYSKML
jgi:hypothetical protein